ncbi:MAG TPA: PP2C family protein-serine/threonine phosphatase [Tepidisphaeraceae bacterium]|nr:PP2C family protein-serine/threonine phosphatase [Tepidisphaeraceae bacterium]
MKLVDLSRNRRIPLLMELVNSMRRLGDPKELLEQIISTMRRAYRSRCFLQLSTVGLGTGHYRIIRMVTSSVASNNGPENLAAPMAVPPQVEAAKADLSVPTDGGLYPSEITSRPIYHGGILGQIVSTGTPNIWHELELGDDPVLGDQLSRYHAAVAAPLFDNELGVNWVVAFAPEPTAFDAHDLEELILRSNLVGSMLGNLATARQLIHANLQIQGELDQIARIQQALLPEEVPEVPGLKIAASYRTFDRAGGDIYDVCRVGSRMQEWQGGPDPRWTLLIGDVSGHGPAAAVVMAMFHAIFHTYPTRPQGPAEVLQHVNRHLCAKRIEQSFVTAFLAFYDPGTRELVYARAGHEPPLLKNFPHRDKPIHLDAVGELPLGIMHDVVYKEARITLQPGQTLILYTDGITDAGHRSGRTFGIDGIENSLIACTGAPDCAIRHIAEALLAHQGQERPDDDQTILAVQVL